MYGVRAKGVHPVETKSKTTGGCYLCCFRACLPKVAARQGARAGEQPFELQEQKLEIGKVDGT